MRKVVWPEEAMWVAVGRNSTQQVGAVGRDQIGAYWVMHVTWAACPDYYKYMSLHPKHVHALIQCVV